jgi:hypothetical protein
MHRDAGTPGQGMALRDPSPYVSLNRRTMTMHDEPTTGHLSVPIPISAGLILSYKCSAECRHCMYFCSPKWSEDWMSEEDLVHCLSALAGKIMPSPFGPNMIDLSHGLHFTGGEPFLNFELLLKATEIANDMGIPSTFVETNCFWCRDDKDTKEKLTLLREAGLKGIMVSVNPYYLEFVPFERTERCVRIAQEVFDRTVAVYQAEYYKYFREMEIKDRMSLEKYVKLGSGDKLANRVEMFLMGRATTTLRELYSKHPSIAFFGEPCVSPFMRDWHNHFDNYGNFIPGFCAGISLGSWRDLDSLLVEGVSAADHPVLAILATENIEKLLDFAREYGYEDRVEGYISKCDLCLDIRKHLFDHEEFVELAPAEFYDQV